MTDQRNVPDDCHFKRSEATPYCIDVPSLSIVLAKTAVRGSIVNRMVAKYMVQWTKYRSGWPTFIRISGHRMRIGFRDHRVGNSDPPRIKILDTMGNRADENVSNRSSVPSNDYPIWKQTLHAYLHVTMNFWSCTWDHTNSSEHMFQFPRSSSILTKNVLLPPLGKINTFSAPRI
jgi:hypothetical protein